MPLVSVVMPVYNGERFLAEAIESILAQTFADFEFIIVDDGSADGSAAIIHSYAKQDDRVRVIQLKENLGQPSARNAGIAGATGEYIAAMDCDDISLPERLQQQVEFLATHPGIGAVGVGAQQVTEDLTPISTFEIPACHPLITFNMFTGGGTIVRASMMARREFLEAAGGYNATLRAGPDFEFFLRLVWQNRIRYANIPDTQYLYRRHDASISHKQMTGQLTAAADGRRRALEMLWGEAPEETLQRFLKLRPWAKLSWNERRLTRRDLHRLIESQIAHNWIDPDDRSLLYDEVKRRLESTAPRFWQRCLHWYRYRIGRFLA